MTPEFWAIIGVGIGIAGLFDTLIAAFAKPREE